MTKQVWEQNRCMKQEHCILDSIVNKKMSICDYGITLK